MGKTTKEGREPTVMGQRIVDLLKVNNIQNRAAFAEGVLGISRQRFHKWLYGEMRDVEAKPLLKCADALGTNPEYLLGLTDDLRPQHSALDDQETQLVDAFRSMSRQDQERLLKNAADWSDESTAPATSGAPFRGVGRQRGAS